MIKSTKPLLKPSNKMLADQQLPETEEDSVTWAAYSTVDSQTEANMQVFHNIEKDKFLRTASRNTTAEFTTARAA